MNYCGYKVFENGDILGKRGWILKPNLNKTGYLRVGIYTNGKAKTMSVHRIVAECYIPNPENKPEVDHIKYKEITNNHISNLRWATRTEQQINRGLSSNNTSGIKGVCKDKNSWMAHLTFNKKTYSKTFKTFEEAVAQRRVWELEHHQL